MQVNKHQMHGEMWWRRAAFKVTLGVNKKTKWENLKQAIKAQKEIIAYDISYIFLNILHKWWMHVFLMIPLDYNVS